MQVIKGNGHLTTETKFAVGAESQYWPKFRNCDSALNTACASTKLCTQPPTHANCPEILELS